MDYFVPQLLGTLVGEREAEAKAVFEALTRPVVDASEFEARDSRQRTAIENDRLYRFSLMYEALTEKYDNALRTRRLLEEVRQSKCGMVLFLRGFSFEVHYDDAGSVGFEADLGEYQFRFDLARKLAPTPVVLIRNPNMSEPLLRQFHGAESAAANTFSIEADDTWLSTVRSLLDIASCVVVYNNRGGDGLRSEIELLRTLNRLDDAYFSDPSQQHGRRADDDGLAQIRRSVRPRGHPSAGLPPPTCWWLQGDRRRRVRDNVLWIYELFNTWAAQGQTLPLDMQTRLLGFALAGSVLLERPDLLIMSLLSYGHCLAGYGNERLPECRTWSERYYELAGSLARAIDRTRSERTVFDYDDLPALTTLMNEETPEVVVPETMRIIGHMPERLTLSTEA